MSPDTRDSSAVGRRVCTHDKQLHIDPAETFLSNFLILLFYYILYRFINNFLLSFPYFHLFLSWFYNCFLNAKR